MISFRTVITIFLHILPAPLYTVEIVWATSLCPFQKTFVIIRPAIFGSKSFSSQCLL